MQNQIKTHTLRLGYDICKNALRHEDKCTWLTKEYNATDSKVTFEPAGVEFYKGLSGIAFFLAALYDFQPRPLFKKTAIGAARQALTLTPGIERKHTFSFFRGLPGLLFTLTKINDYCGENLFSVEIKELLHRLLAADLKQSSIDVIEGLGSGIPAMLYLQKRLDAPELTAKITAAVDRLYHLAETERDKTSWHTSASDGDRNLPGFSHGTAGIAHALLRYAHYEGGDKYADLARRALNYEEYCLSEREQSAAHKSLGHRGVDTSCDWAHGLAGLAQTYLSQYLQAEDKRAATKANAALHRSYRQYADTEITAFDFSVTNGIFGVTDALLNARTVLDNEEYRRMAEDLTEKALKQNAADGNHWGGTHEMTAEVPDFMISQAGIGYALLRLADPVRYRSVLCL